MKALRNAILLVAALAAVLGVPGALIAILLSCWAETISGRLFALSFLGLYGSAWFLDHGFRKRQLRVKRAGLILLCLAAAGFVVCYLRSPSGISSASARLQSTFPAGTRYPRWSPVNLVPEIDQAKLGAMLSPLIDPIMTRRRAKRMNELFSMAYREMESDREFTDVGSLMNKAYWDAFDFSCDQRHFYSYVPNHTTNEKLPAIVFLHGSCGNFKVYIWTWKRFADQHHVAVVAPTFGFGNWHKPGGLEAIERAYRFCADNPLIDQEKIFLAGLSNGGLGVTKAAAAHPGRYRGLIYISGVLDPDQMNAPSFWQGSKDNPVLVIHGREDERIPLSFIQKTLAMLPASVSVETRYYANEDHFLFLSKRNEMLDDIHRWMMGH